MKDRTMTREIIAREWFALEEQRQRIEKERGEKIQSIYKQMDSLVAQDEEFEKFKEFQRGTGFRYNYGDWFTLLEIKTRLVEDNAKQYEVDFIDAILQGNRLL